MTLQKFAAKKPLIFWSTRNYRNLSDEAIVEGVLEYGDFDDIKKVISILGRNKTAEIFNNKIKSDRHNFDPKIENYFKLYFNNEPRDTDR